MLYKVICLFYANSFLFCLLQRVVRLVVGTKSLQLKTQYGRSERFAIYYGTTTCDTKTTQNIKETNLRRINTSNLYNALKKEIVSILRNKKYLNKIVIQGLKNKFKYRYLKKTKDHIKIHTNSATNSWPFMWVF